MPKFVVVEFDGLSGDTTITIAEAEDDQEVYEEYEDSRNNVIVCPLDDFESELKRVGLKL